MKQFAALVRVALLSVTLLSACAPARVPGPAEQVAENPLLGLTAYANPDVLVDPAWVAARATDPTLKVVHIASDPAEYAGGHVPGAQLIVPADDLIDAANPVPGEALTRDQLSALFSRLGITATDTVVVYDNNNNLDAARAYWVFKYYQHADVRLLNGGLKKWLADGQPVTDEVPAVPASAYQAAEPDAAIIATFDEVTARIGTPGVVIADTRSLLEYVGIDVRADRGGHIPDAVHLEWRNALNADGTFLEPAKLAQLYASQGFDPSREVIAYCQTGVRSAHTWFVLHELLGFDQVRNYDGSWIEYANRPEAVVEK